MKLVLITYYKQRLIGLMKCLAVAGKVSVFNAVLIIMTIN